MPKCVCVGEGGACSLEIAADVVIHSAVHVCYAASLSFVMLASRLVGADTIAKRKADTRWTEDTAGFSERSTPRMEDVTQLSMKSVDSMELLPRVKS